MENAKRFTYFAGVLCIGLSLTGCSDDPDKPIPTVTVTETVSHLEIKEVKVQVPLPKSCKDIPIIAAKFLEGEDIINTASAEILSAGTALERDSVVNDYKGMTASLQKVRDNTNLITDKVYIDAQNQLDLTIAVEKCKKDME